MKVFFYSLCGLALLARPAAAQTVTNANFETWATRNGVEAPTGWLTTDDVYAYYMGVAVGSYDVGAVKKSTDAHGGSYAAQLTTTSVPLNNGTSALVPGILVLGTAVTRYTYLDIPSGGAGFTKRPTQMQFSYKFNGVAADSALVLVYTTNTSSPTLIGLGGGYLAPAATYTTVTVPIGYDAADNSTPDSIHIVFASGYSRRIAISFPTNIKVGSTLLVDDISFSGGNVLAVRADAGTQAQLTVAPNPSPAGRFQLAAPAEPALASAAYTVSDLLGRVVAQQPALTVPRPVRELDLGGLRTGIYLLRLNSPKGVITRQLVVQ